jgi:hypothetical protein
MQLDFISNSDFVSSPLAELHKTLGVLSDIRKELRLRADTSTRKVLLLCNRNILGRRSGRGYSIANPLSCQRYLKYITSNLGYGDVLYMALAPDDHDHDHDYDEDRLNNLMTEIEEGQYELIISVGRRLTEWLLGVEFKTDEAFIKECRSVIDKPFRSPNLSYPHTVIPMIAPGMVEDTEEAIESLACSLAAF